MAIICCEFNMPTLFHTIPLFHASLHQHITRTAGFRCWLWM